MKTIKTLFVIAFAILITSTAKAQHFNYKLDGPFATAGTSRMLPLSEKIVNPQS